MLSKKDSLGRTIPLEIEGAPAGSSCCHRRLIGRFGHKRPRTRIYALPTCAEILPRAYCVTYCQLSCCHGLGSSWGRALGQPGLSNGPGWCPEVGRASPEFPRVHSRGAIGTRTCPSEPNDMIIPACPLQPRGPRHCGMPVVALLLRSNSTNVLRNCKPGVRV
jgi:hypothetical protein